MTKLKLDTARCRIAFEVHGSARMLHCPHCGIDDRLRRSWKHLDFLEFDPWLHEAVSYMA